jgi:outer membrane protein assembly factor BamE (lipoprotein component of BamABCDE complex)
MTVMISLATLAGCKTAGQHTEDVRQAGDTSSKITVGTVQRKIKVGMSSAEVIEALGAPNMVTTDSLRRENWVYDKISTERAYSESVGGVSVLILGSLGSSGAETTTQRTLTIIIKYDKANYVRDFAYRYSSF